MQQTTDDNEGDWNPFGEIPEDDNGSEFNSSIPVETATVHIKEAIRAHAAYTFYIFCDTAHSVST